MKKRKKNVKQQIGLEKLLETKVSGLIKTGPCSNEIMRYRLYLINK